MKAMGGEGKGRDTLVLGNANAFAGQVAWFGDVCVGVDVHALMAKVAGGKDRQGNERRMLLVQRENVRRQRQLRYIEFLEAELPKEPATAVRLATQMQCRTRDVPTSPRLGSSEN